MAENPRRSRKIVLGQVIPIDVLNDDVLLGVFDFYVEISRGKEAWQALVHVCRRWRRLVFESPRRLDLHLVCTPRTPPREKLDVWPALPLIVKATFPSTSSEYIVDALGHRDRVSQIYFRVETGGLQWYTVLSAMQVEFPALTHLLLECRNETALVIPDTFLGGYAPRLQSFHSFGVYAIKFPGLPKLLLSATHLVNLRLYCTSWYISPEAMAGCLSMLTSLAPFPLRFHLQYAVTGRIDVYLR